MGTRKNVRGILMDYLSRKRNPNFCQCVGLPSLVSPCLGVWQRHQHPPQHSERDCHCGAEFAAGGKALQGRVASSTTWPPYSICTLRTTLSDSQSPILRPQVRVFHVLPYWSLALDLWRSSRSEAPHLRMPDFLLCAGRCLDTQCSVRPTCFLFLDQILDIIEVLAVAQDITRLKQALLYLYIVP